MLWVTQRASFITLSVGATGHAYLVVIEGLFTQEL